MSSFKRLKKLRILLVDDDDLIRDSLTMAFKTKGCFLRAAENAEEGLKALQQERFDIIISDFRLPGINGLEFLKLTSVTQPDAIRFLITAYRDDYIFSDTPFTGIDEFIEKPFAVKALVNLLASALKHQEENRAALAN